MVVKPPPKEVVEYPRRSHTQRTVRLRIINKGGDDEVYEYPCETQITVEEIVEHLSELTFIEKGNIDLLNKQGAYMQKLQYWMQPPKDVIVKGLKSFKPEEHKWPHPYGIIGTGYMGMKVAMCMLNKGKSDIVMFDRNKHVGGYCWITGANKTSRLQTEMPSFHVWYGFECLNEGIIDYPNCNVDETKEGNVWHIWPYKEEMLRHFKLAAEMWGLNQYCYFGTNVESITIVGKKDAEDRKYECGVRKLNTGPTPKDTDYFKVSCSVLYNFPGSLTRNRIIEYPGEELFGGPIRYGMNDDTPYDLLPDSTIAILGNGAFAVENARTCIECQGKKAYIVTRRRNLCSPRMPSWFCHQGPFPTPGPLLMKMMVPMYELAGFPDPWTYPAVKTNEKRTVLNIIQNSRFGVGDITFIMAAWGLLEFQVSTVKRMSHECLHLENGEKLNVTIVLKALGLLGDHAVDKMHNMTYIQGPFVQGDWRRVISIDDTGLNAQNFTTFSIGIGGADNAITWLNMHSYPKEWYRLADNVLPALNKHYEEPEVDKPAYVADVLYKMSTSMIIEGAYAFKVGGIKSLMPPYKYTLYHKSCSTDRVLEVAKREWDENQEKWKARGIEHAHIEYPYTREKVKGWFDEYNRHFTKEMPGYGGPNFFEGGISVDGPKEDFIKTAKTFKLS